MNATEPSVEVALRAGDLSAAREAAEREVVLRPDDPAAAALLGRVLLAERRPSEVLRVTARWEGRGVDAIDEVRAEALTAGERHGEAARLAGEVIARSPGRVGARLCLGRALYHSGETLRGLREVRRAVELAPEHADARTRLGGMLVALGRAREAATELARAVELDPRSAAARQNLATALVVESRYSDAVAALAPLTDAPALDPEIAAAAVELLEQVYAAERQPRALALATALRAHGRSGGGAHQGSGAAGDPVAIARARHGAGGARRANPSRPVLAMDAARELVALARRGALDAVYGRGAEIDRLIDVLLRRKKSNPLIVGPAGVGKTALVEGLAHRIAAGDVPERLRAARIVELSVASLVAGCAYRGELEEKLEALLAELRADRSAVLFLDEIHTLVGAGGAASGGRGELDASEVLKPALARGEIAVIGATTHEAYQRTIARDPALARRFAMVEVAEPARDEALAMLGAAARDLEGFHGVRYDGGVLAEIVELSSRFLPERCLPDKGIDLLDHAAVRAVRAGRAAVTSAEVCAAVADLARVPVATVASGAGQLAGLAAKLRETIHGQGAACDRVAEVLLVRGLGLGGDDPRPRGVFLFVGPPGCGKTALARSLAAALHGGVERLVRIDMSELAERHETARLLGAPAGYVGHDEGGLLARALRASPGAVVLLDEIEKAHPDVLNVFLQLFDAGRLTDGRGDTVDARQATFVLTSNLSERATGSGPLGFSPAADTADEGQHARRERDARERLRERLRPELLGRLDAVLVFEPLAPPALRAVAADHLARAVASLARQGVELAVDPDVAAALAACPEVREHGARAVVRAIEREVLLPAARCVLADGSRRALRARMAADGTVAVGAAAGGKSAAS